MPNMTELGHPLDNLIPPLTLTDRCDICNAQARFAVFIKQHDNSPLMFCKHHADVIETNPQVIYAHAIRDERHLLVAEEANRK